MAPAPGRRREVPQTDQARGPGLVQGDGGQCQVWGVLNVTPDSFSDGDKYLTFDAALERGKVLLAEGADVIDVGGASSRPRGQLYGAGAADVPADVEAARVQPVVRVLAGELGALVSI